METDEHEAAVTGDEVNGHATTPGAALAGAVTGGVIGLAGGPVSAALGAAGGAIVGALSERLLHGSEDEQQGLDPATNDLYPIVDEGAEVRQ
jgi:hypothetical protein